MSKPSNVTHVQGEMFVKGNKIYPKDLTQVPLNGRKHAKSQRL